jgi:hypothetical protein
MNFPKYIYTLQDYRFKKLKENIILIGKNNGIIYVKTQNKEELFEKIKNLNDRNEKICCYSECVEFSLIEMKILLYFNVKILRIN